MSCNFFRLLRAACLLLIFSSSVSAQKPGQSGNQAGQQGSQGNQTSQTAGGAAGSQGLQGLSFPPQQWPYLRLPDVKGPAPTWKEGRTVICYKVAKANSGSQPFVLQPLGINEIRGSGFYRPCGDGGKGETDSEGQRRCQQKEVEESTNHWSACSTLQSPILMNQILVIGVDVSDLGESGVNIDQLKLLNISVTNQQGSALNPSPIRSSFPSTTSAGGGGGLAGSAGGALDTSGKGNWWVFVGTQPPEGSYPKPWEPSPKIYKKGDVVSDAAGAHFYMANRNFPAGPRPKDPFPTQPRIERIMDGEVIWQEMNDPGPDNTSSYWHEHQDYLNGDVVCVERNPKAPTVGPPALTQVLPDSNLFAQLWQEPDSSGRKSSTSDDASAIREELPQLCKDVKAKIEMETPPDQKKKSKARQTSLHYYWAVKGGRSGSAPADPLSMGLIPRAIYLTWPYQLPGDVIPTFTVNMVYSPPVPGAPWQGNTFYPAGSVVTSSANEGHYYTALTGGFSSSEPKQPVFPVNSPPTFPDGTLLWMDSGTSAPNIPPAAGSGSAAQSSGGGGGQGGGGQGGGQSGGASGAGKPQLWFKNTHYIVGDVIFNPNNGHYYTVMSSTGGMSGPTPSAQGGSADPFPQTPSQAPLLDGQVQWVPTNVKTANPWAAKHAYTIGQEMQAADGRFYLMVGAIATSGLSGDATPFVGTPASGVRLIDKDVYWMYSPQITAAQDWQAKHPYSVGNAVLDGNNHVYVMVGTATGITGSTDPVIQNGSGQPITISDGDLLWADIGTTAGSPANAWVASNSYNIGDVVRGANGHYYQVIRFIAGTSGPGTEFPILQATTTVEPTVTIPDPNPAGVIWLDLGVIRPLGLNQPLHWRPSTVYSPDDVIFVPEIGSGRYYRALQSGQSGNQSPFPNQSIQLPVTWQDSGTTAPTSVANGQPADQNVSLINLTLPQTHSLSYFNIDAGLIVAPKRAPTFGFVPSMTNTATGCTPATNPTMNVAFFCPAQNGHGSVLVDPVLALTIYFPPVDAEVPWPRRHDWWRELIPGFSVALSLANPTTNFYVGGSNEMFVRNVQVFYGVAFRNIATGLAPASNQPSFGGTGTPPAVATVSGFQKGFFIGMTYNLSGFIQSLFSGGAGKGQ